MKTRHRGCAGVFAVAALILIAGRRQADQETAQSEPCDYDREAMLALSQEDFDQDLDGGWRVLAQQPGCLDAAADLIAAWREQNAPTDTLLYWHEGQLRAQDAQNAAAISLFEKSYQAEGSAGWNPYVDATLAFMRKDRPALEAARAELASLQMEPWFEELAGDMEAQTGVRPNWPPNLDVVDGLIACFDQPYSVAYSAVCRDPALTRAPAE